MEFAEAKERGDITSVGLPFEGILSGLPGMREGPHFIRKASYLLESYVPGLNVDLRYVQFNDLGNVELFGSPERVTEDIAEVTAGIKYPVALGGDHSITIGIVNDLIKRYGELHVIYFDAHWDLRDSYGDSSHSHACVASRLLDMGAKITFLGVRSGSREEWERGKTLSMFGPDETWPDKFSEPVYITVDIDVFDPAFAPGVGTPEPAGITPSKFFNWLYRAKIDKIVGFDVAETNPLIEDHITPILAARIVRDMIAKMWVVNGGHT
jgi:agmatinase